MNEKVLEMFIPVPDTMHKTLSEAFLTIFLGNNEERVAGHTKPYVGVGQQKVMLPSFANKLTLLLSVKIPTQQEPAGTQELNRTKSCLPGGNARLEEHILSTDLWDLDVAVDYDWCWTLPPGGKLTMWTLLNRCGFFREHSQWVSRL